LISSSDRRILDELDPDSTQSARDRQLIGNQPAGNLSTPGFHRRPVISTESIHGKTRKQLGNPQPARLAFQLEARLTQSTILSNVSLQTKHATTRYAEFAARKLCNVSVWFAGSWQTFQETPSTQWQKN
jgi:hypothetical protein